MFVRNTEFVNNGYNDIDARTLWHYQAICVSPNLLSTTPVHALCTEAKGAAYHAPPSSGGRVRDLGMNASI